MNFRQLGIWLSAITLGVVLLLFQPFIAMSQWTPSTPDTEPTYRISNNFGIVVNSEKQDLAEGYFVMREGKTWVRFETQNAPRAIPVSP